MVMQASSEAIFNKERRARRDARYLALAIHSLRANLKAGFEQAHEAAQVAASAKAHE